MSDVFKHIPIRRHASVLTILVNAGFETPDSLTMLCTASLEPTLLSFQLNGFTIAEMVALRNWSLAKQVPLVPAVDVPKDAYHESFGAFWDTCLRVSGHQMKGFKSHKECLTTRNGHWFSASGYSTKKNHTKQLAELLPNIEWWNDPILRVLLLIRVVLLACMCVAF